MGRLSKRVINTKKTESKKKRQTMKKNSFKTCLLSFTAFCSLALALASCANEDVAQSTTGTDNDKNLTTFVAGDEAKTRTSMDYSNGDFYWEDGDKIWVKDDDGTWQQSSNAPTAKVASFKFKVPGKFTKGNTYKVYYPGKNGNKDQVTISATQTQETPNTTKHFGESGDCGTADASWSNAKSGFAFTLEHQAAILVFQPYTNHSILKNCYLTKIEVTSDKDITHTYTLSATTGMLTGIGTGKQIVLTTKGSGAYVNGFPLNTTSASLTTNGAYMVIKPGTHILRVRYWVKDMVTNVEGTVTKFLGSFNYAKNTYYDMTASLDIKNYDGDHYYMWDAQDQYWKGHEWNQGGSQPTTNEATSSSDYALNNSDSRWYKEGGSLFGKFDATQSCAIAPNANEIVHYMESGLWDDDELWTAMGHLHKGGAWFKKKAYIAGYSTENLPNSGHDLRESSWLVPYAFFGAAGSPPPANASKYFYLPALGYYAYGQAKYVGERGFYWTSSGDGSTGTYILVIEGPTMYIMDYVRDCGARVQVFE